MIKLQETGNSTRQPPHDKVKRCGGDGMGVVGCEYIGIARSGRVMSPARQEAQQQLKQTVDAPRI